MNDEPKPTFCAIVEPEGRWTMQREDETPAEAMNRLIENGPGCYPLPDGLNSAVPRFRSK